MAHSLHPRFGPIHRAPLIVLALCLGAGLFATPALGLDFSNYVVVYEETFDGEASFPTTPETNLIAASDLLDFGDGPPGPAPPSTGTAVAESVSPASHGGRRVNALSTSITTESFALRTEFSGFSPGGFNNHQITTHAAGPCAAVLGGAAFVIDCRVDRVGEHVTGSIDIDGFPSFGVGPMPLLYLEPTDPVATLGQQLAANSPALLPETFADLDLESFQILQPVATEPFAHQLDRAEVIGNASGGVGCSEDFGAGLGGWLPIRGEPVALGGFVTFQDPGEVESVLSTFYDVEIAREDIQAPANCHLSATGGAASLITEWVATCRSCPVDTTDTSSCTRSR